MGRRSTGERSDLMAGPAVLIVSEDPFFIEEARRSLRPDGHRVVGCLGPSHSSCPLLERGTCPLAEHADFVLVDSPESGEFRYHAFDITAGKYAETLQDHHAATRVLLSGAPVGHSGPTGEVICTEDRTQALSLITGFEPTNEGREVR